MYKAIVRRYRIWKRERLIRKLEKSMVYMAEAGKKVAEQLRRFKNDYQNNREQS